MKTNMKTNMKEMNLEEMEKVNGAGIFSDIMCVVLGGPVGEALVATKYILQATKK